MKLVWKGGGGTRRRTPLLGLTGEDDLSFLSLRGGEREGQIAGGEALLDDDEDDDDDDDDDQGTVQQQK